MGTEYLENSFAENNLGILVDKLNNKHLEAKKAKSPGLHLSEHTQPVKAGDPFLLSTGEAHPVLVSQTDMEILEQVWKKAMEHLSYEGRLRELGLLRLEKKRVRRDLINVFKYLIGGVKKLKSHSSQ